jgi:hypothetical protein
MTLRLYWKRVKHTIRIAGYFGLLVITLSGLMFQGGIWQLAGTLCWVVIVGSFIAQHIYNNYEQLSKRVSKNLEPLLKNIE